MVCQVGAVNPKEDDEAEEEAKEGPSKRDKNEEADPKPNFENGEVRGVQGQDGFERNVEQEDFEIENTSKKFRAKIKHPTKSKARQVKSGAKQLLTATPLRQELASSKSTGKQRFTGER